MDQSTDSGGGREAGTARMISVLDALRSQASISSDKFSRRGAFLPFARQRFQSKISNSDESDAPSCMRRNNEGTSSGAESGEVATGQKRTRVKNLLWRLTAGITATYKECHPQFSCVKKINRRVVTRPSEPVGNDGKDNEEGNLILRTNDVLESRSDRYVVVDALGQGTFGQVVRCQNLASREIVAIKVIKNKPAYFNQALLEVRITKILNERHDPDGRHHIVRLKDYFMHNNHLCIVFELLSINLYELIKRNQFRGLSLAAVRHLSKQMLESLALLLDADIIHCDLKPENVLIDPTLPSSYATCSKTEGGATDCPTVGGEAAKPSPELGSPPSATVPAFPPSSHSSSSCISSSSSSSSSVVAASSSTSCDTGDSPSTLPNRVPALPKQYANIKLIDFGSACFEQHIVYSYIQSRFYRSPEVLLGLHYDGSIDMWSFACISAELFLGLPLFPGVSEHDQMSRIVDMLGYPPQWMLDSGSGTTKFFRRLPSVDRAFVYQGSSCQAVGHANSGSVSAKPTAWDRDGIEEKKEKALSPMAVSPPIAIVKGHCVNGENNNGCASSVGASTTMKLKAASNNVEFEEQPRPQEKYVLKSAEEYAKESKTTPAVSKRYFKYRKLEDIVMAYPMRRGLSEQEVEEERQHRACFVHFLQGSLRLDPSERWTPRQALAHPFIAGRTLPAAGFHMPPDLRRTTRRPPQWELPQSIPAGPYWGANAAPGSLPAKRAQFRAVGGQVQEGGALSECAHSLPGPNAHYQALGENGGRGIASNGFPPSSGPNSGAVMQGYGPTLSMYANMSPVGPAYSSGSDWSPQLGVYSSSAPNHYNYLQDEFVSSLGAAGSSPSASYVSQPPWPGLEGPRGTFSGVSGACTRRRCHSGSFSSSVDAVGMHPTISPRGTSSFQTGNADRVGRHAATGSSGSPWQSSPRGVRPSRGLPPSWRSFHAQGQCSNPPSPSMYSPAVGPECSAPLPSSPSFDLAGPFSSRRPLNSARGPGSGRSDSTAQGPHTSWRTGAPNTVNLRMDGPQSFSRGEESQDQVRGSMWQGSRMVSVPGAAGGGWAPEDASQKSAQFQGRYFQHPVQGPVQHQQQLQPQLHQRYHQQHQHQQHMTFSPTQPAPLSPFLQPLSSPGRSPATLYTSQPPSHKRNQNLPTRTGAVHLHAKAQGGLGDGASDASLRAEGTAVFGAETRRWTHDGTQLTEPSSTDGAARLQQGWSNVAGCARGTSPSAGRVRSISHPFPDALPLARGSSSQYVSASPSRSPVFSTAFLRGGRQNEGGTAERVVAEPPHLAPTPTSLGVGEPHPSPTRQRDCGPKHWPANGPPSSVPASSLALSGGSLENGNSIPPVCVSELRGPLSDTAGAVWAGQRVQDGVRSTKLAPGKEDCGVLQQSNSAKGVGFSESSGGPFLAGGVGVSTQGALQATVCTTEGGCGSVDSSGCTVFNSSNSSSRTQNGDCSAFLNTSTSNSSRTSDSSSGSSSSSHNDNNIYSRAAGTYPCNERRRGNCSVSTAFAVGGSAGRGCVPPSQVPEKSSVGPRSKDVLGRSGPGIRFLTQSAQHNARVLPQDGLQGQNPDTVREDMVIEEIEGGPTRAQVVPSPEATADGGASWDPFFMDTLEESVSMKSPRSSSSARAQASD